MKVKRIGFVGVRTEDVERTTWFFRDVLGLDGGRNDPEWTISRLPTHRFDLVEVYGPGFDDERLAPPDPGVFVAFVVDDVTAAHAEVRAAGLEPSEILWAEEAFDQAAYAGLAWFMVRAPDGNVYVIEQTPD